METDAHSGTTTDITTMIETDTGDSLLLFEDTHNIYSF